MAAADSFTITVHANGGHAAMPHNCTDPIVAAAQLVLALQPLISRATDPVESAVISVTQVHSGTTFNVIADRAELAGTSRSLQPGVRDALEQGIRRVVAGIALTCGVEIALDYQRCYPATINHLEQSETAIAVAKQIVGSDSVHTGYPPVMGSEDFAFMLEKCPGAYLWIGQGKDGMNCPIHNPYYDFNDEILPIGASILARLVERRLE
jgi:amidohydrolase